MADIYSVIKPAQIPTDARLRTYWDTQDVVQNQATYNFFQAGQTQTRTLRNYISNPLPSTQQRQVLALSLESTLQVIRSATNIDPVAIADALGHGILRFQVGSDNELVYEGRIQEFLDVDEYTVNRSGDATSGYTQIEAVTLGSFGFVRIPDAFLLRPNENFTFEVQFEDASQFPAAADWTGAGYGKLSLVGKILVAER